MVMMPATMTTAIPAVVVAATAVMAPPMPMPMSMPVAASDLNNNGLIDSAQRRGCRCRHGGRRHGWRKYKSTAGKSDYQKPLHLVPPPLLQMVPDYRFRFCNVA
jgi:hypothetical protein